jgi:DNA-3-methyladenine glycosylase II
MKPRVSIVGGQSRSTREERLFRADPALGRVIATVTARLGAQRINPSKASPFESLVRAIVYQSVSGKAAATIFAGLKTSLGGSVRPAAVTKRTPTALHSVGLSGSKSRAIRGLADWFCANPGTARRITQLPDEEIITSLTSIPGIGLWTVNVFLIFSLARPDVIPAADLSESCLNLSLERSETQPQAERHQGQEESMKYAYVGLQANRSVPQCPRRPLLSPNSHRQPILRMHWSGKIAQGAGRRQPRFTVGHAHSSLRDRIELLAHGV